MRHGGLSKTRTWCWLIVMLRVMLTVRQFRSLAGRSVIVTGGSKGIGKGIARVFAQCGARVVVTGRDAVALNAAVVELSAAGTVRGVCADVTSLADMRRAVDVAEAEHGGVDILCANAGIYPAARIADMTEAQWDEVCSEACVLRVAYLRRSDDRAWTRDCRWWM